MIFSCGPIRRMYNETECDICGYKGGQDSDGLVWECDCYQIEESYPCECSEDAEVTGIYNSKDKQESWECDQCGSDEIPKDHKS